MIFLLILVILQTIVIVVLLVKLKNLQESLSYERYLVKHLREVRQSLEDESTNRNQEKINLKKQIEHVIKVLTNES